MKLFLFHFRKLCEHSECVRYMKIHLIEVSYLRYTCGGHDCLVCCFSSPSTLCIVIV